MLLRTRPRLAARAHTSLGCPLFLYRGINGRDIYTDFEDFFDEHPDGTYPGPGPDAELKFGHAVVLVG